MEFQNNVQKETYEKVSQWLGEIFGEFVRKKEDAPSFRVAMGSTFISVGVIDWGDNQAIICARSPLVQGVEITPDLMRFLLEKNNAMAFGAFSIDSDGDINFDHTIYGPTCTKEDLRISTKAVLFTADKFDDEIVSRWGGKRALDD